jgi:Helix-turn-helix domain
MENSILIHEAHSLNIPAKPFKLLFAMNAFPKTYGIFPLEEKIAENSKMPIATVQRAKKWLKDNGYISWVKKSTVGKRGDSCSYQINQICYDQPGGWEYDSHFFLKATMSKDFTPEQWRFLCLLNTVYGWGADKQSVKSMLIKWKMEPRMFRKTWRELMDKEAVDGYLCIEGELFFKTEKRV